MFEFGSFFLTMAVSMSQCQDVSSWAFVCATTVHVILTMCANPFQRPTIHSRASVHDVSCTCGRNPRATIFAHSSVTNSHVLSPNSNHLVFLLPPFSSCFVSFSA
jgi:hypothetical protein